MKLKFKKGDKKRMPLFPDKHFHISIVDPPYGIGEAGKNHKSRDKIVKSNGSRIRKTASTKYLKKDWDSKIPDDAYFIELQRVSQNQIIFGANYFPYIVGTAFKPPRRNQYKEFIESYPTGWIIWDKVNGECDFNDCELIYTSFNIPTRIFYFMWSGMMQGKSISEGHIMQGNKKLNQKRTHPTEKPIILYKFIFREFVKKGQRVIDTHIGSGKIVIVAIETGCEITGCEKETDYYTIFLNMLDDYKRQLSLF